MLIFCILYYIHYVTLKFDSLILKLLDDISISSCLVGMVRRPMLWFQLTTVTKVRWQKQTELT